MAEYSLPSVDITINKWRLFDNLLTRYWYDLLFLRASPADSKTEYLICKNLTLLTHFFAYGRGHFLSSRHERLNYLLERGGPRALFGLSKSDVHNLRTRLTTPESETHRVFPLNQSGCYARLWAGLKPVFIECESTYSGYNYWEYDPGFHQPIGNGNDSVREESAAMLNSGFAWRCRLFQFFVELDVLFSSIPTREQIYGALTLVFLPDIAVKLLPTTPCRSTILFALERIRIDTSSEGVDIVPDYTCP